MLVALAGLAVVFAVLGLGFYTVGRTPLRSMRLTTSLLRVFSLSIEIESSGEAGKPPGVAGQGAGPEGPEGEIPGPAASEALPEK